MFSDLPQPHVFKTWLVPVYLNLHKNDIFYVYDDTITKYISHKYEWLVLEEWYSNVFHKSEKVKCFTYTSEIEVVNALIGFVTITDMCGNMLATSNPWNRTRRKWNIFVLRIPEMKKCLKLKSEAFPFKKKKCGFQLYLEDAYNTKYNYFLDSRKIS